MVNTRIDNNGIAWITFDLPGEKFNVLSRAVLIAFEKDFHAALNNQQVKAIALASAKNDFMAGADLKEILAVTDQESCRELLEYFRDVFNSIETSPKPVAVAINGVALGGGLEICLACHFRVALDSPKVKLGLPEVKLGLIPGAGGTQRLIRIVGLSAALLKVLEGSNFDVAEAHQAGLVHALAPNPDALEKTITKWLLKNEPVKQPWRQKTYKIPGGDSRSPENAAMLSVAAAQIEHKTRGNYPAPKAILDCMVAGSLLPIDAALELEISHFIQCLLGGTAREMIRTLFFEMNRAKSRKPTLEIREVKEVGILGAGMMGAGIAYAIASSGLKVILKDIDQAAAQKGKLYSEKVLQKRVDANRLAKEDMASVLDNITPSGDYADLKNCDLIIEAVFEDRGLKKKVYADSENIMGESCFLASNTSTLPITGLAESLKKPEEFIGLHFFSPVNKMQLVEVILGEKTSRACETRAVDFVRRIGKIPVVVRDGRGFFTSRVFKSYVYEGFRCLKDGILPGLIENAGKFAGMPVGPLAVADEVSLELLAKIQRQQDSDYGSSPRDTATDVLFYLVDVLHRLGRKTGGGFYQYPEGEKKALWRDLTTHYPNAQNQPDLNTVKKRLLYIQCIEALKAMEEGILKTPGDGDLASVLGIGFPTWTGGVFSYIHHLGLENFTHECGELAALWGERFEAPALATEMVQRGDVFFP